MLVLPILAATRRVFAKMLGSESTVGKPVALRDWHRHEHANIVIPVEGHYRGAFVISVSTDSATKIANELLGHASAESNEGESARALRDCVRMMMRITLRDARMQKVRMDPPLYTGNGKGGELLQNLRPWIAIPLKTQFGEVVVGASVRLANSPAEPKSAADAEQDTEQIAAV